MRVLVFGMSGDKLGGINTFLTEMNRAMSEDCIFDYVVEGPNCVSERWIREKGGKVFHFPYYRKNPLGAIKAINSILKENRESHPIAYFNFYSMFFALEPILAKRLGYKVILHAHNNEIATKSGLYRAVHNFNRFLYRGFHCERLTNSDLSTDFMFGRKYRNSAVLVYNAIDCSRFSFCREKREEMRTSLCLAEKHVYGFSGRIAYQKNPVFLVDIFAQVAKEDPKSAFLLIGDGDMMEEARERAKERGISPIFVGSVPNAEDYYQAMDVFIFPSHFEGLGISLVEAQTAGLPCLASAGVIPDLVKVTDLLTFYPLENSADLWAKEAVRIMSEQNPKRESYGKLLEGTGFNIVCEAKKLEKILCS